MLYRIFTENKNYQGVVDIVSSHHDGFTIIKSDGYWKKEAEHSLIIEIDINSPVAIYATIPKICFAIKKLNKQDKILVQKINCESQLI